MRLSELDWAYVDERTADFTGRGWVFERLSAFLHGPYGVLLLLGDPGTGKTAVVAQLVRASAGLLTPGGDVDGILPAVAVDAAYFCRAGKVDLLDVAQRLSDQLAEAVPRLADIRRASLPPGLQISDVQVRTGPVAEGAAVAGVRIDLGALGSESAFLQGVTMPIKRMRESGDRSRVVLLIDALDESLTSPAADALPRLLSAVEHVHLVITSRNDSRAVGALRDRAQVVDLVADAPPGSDDVLTYLRRRLDPHGAPGAMTVLARRIASAAAGNFLYAYYVVEALIEAGGPVGMDELAAHQLPLPEGGLPGIYQNFLRRELGRDSHAWVERFRPVLAALTVAQDEGLDTSQLARIASRLCERPVTRTAVRDVTSAARQYLDGAHPDGPFRIYHQSFASFLVDAEDNPDFLIDPADTHAAVVAAYGSTDPLTWDDYARHNLAVHAAQAGELDELLEDPRFLLATNHERLLSVLPGVTLARATQIAGVYRRAVYELRRRPIADAASYLELHARQAGLDEFGDQVANIELERLWRTRWAHWHSLDPHVLIGHHRGGVTALTTGELDDGPVVVSGGHDGVAQVWDLAGGGLVGEPLRDHTGRVTALATGELDDGPVLAAGSNRGAVRVWDLAAGVVRVKNLARGARVGKPFRGDRTGVTALAMAELDGRSVVVVGSTDSAVRVWDLASGALVGKPLRGRRGAGVMALAMAELDGRSVVVAGDTDGGVRVWDLASGALVGKPPQGHHSLGVTALAMGELDGQQVIIGAGENYLGGPLEVWDLVTGQAIGEQGLGQWRGPVTALAAAKVHGRPVVIVGCHEGAINIWDLASHAPASEPLNAHETEVSTLVVSEQEGRPVVVSGGRDGAVRVWDLAASVPVGKPTRAADDQRVPQEKITALATAELEGRPVVVSGGRDGAVRVWNLANGAPIGKPRRVADDQRMLGKEITALAVGELDGCPVVVSGGSGGRVHDLATGQLISEPQVGEDSLLVVLKLKGRPVVVSGSRRGWVTVHDLATGQPVGEPQRHGIRTTAVAAGELEGRPVVVSGDHDGQVTVRDLATGQPVGEPLSLSYREIAALAVGEREGRSVVVAADRHGSVGVWELLGGAVVSERLLSSIDTEERNLSTLAVGGQDGRPLVISGDRDGYVGVLDLTAALGLTFNIGSAVIGTTIVPPSTVVVGASLGLAVIELANSFSSISGVPDLLGGVGKR